MLPPTSNHMVKSSSPRSPEATPRFGEAKAASPNMASARVTFRTKSLPYCHHIVIISSSLSQSLVSSTTTEGFPTPKLRFCEEHVAFQDVRSSLAANLRHGALGCPQRSPRENSGARGCFAGRSSEGGDGCDGSDKSQCLAPCGNMSKH